MLMTIVILGMMGDKDAAGIAKGIRKIPDDLMITKANMTRAADPEQLSKHFDACTITRDLDDALEEARKLKKEGDKILITGSIFLVGEFLESWKKN